MEIKNIILLVLCIVIIVLFIIAGLTAIVGLYKQTAFSLILFCIMLVINIAYSAYLVHINYNTVISILSLVLSSMIVLLIILILFNYKKL
jgi:hypothetical protein